MLDIFAKIAVIVVLIAVIFLVYIGAGWKKRRACEVIIEDLKRKGATDPASAIELPYVSTQYYEFGMKNYKVNALEFLVTRNVICKADNGRFYMGEIMNAGS